jgi:hypothetical protein
MPQKVSPAEKNFGKELCRVLAAAIKTSPFNYKRVIS